MRISVGLVIGGVAVAALAAASGFVAGRASVVQKQSMAAVPTNEVVGAGQVSAPAVLPVAWGMLPEHSVGVDEACRALRDFRTSRWADGTLYFGEAPTFDGYTHVPRPVPGSEEEFAEFFALMQGRPRIALLCNGVRVVRASDTAFPPPLEIDVDALLARLGPYPVWAEKYDDATKCWFD